LLEIFLVADAEHGVRIAVGVDQGHLVEAETLRADFIGKGIAGSTIGRAVGTAGLDHEVGHDAVKGQAIVEGLCCGLAGGGIGERLRAFCKAEEVGDGFGRFV
jgi:hypothetical protein